MKMIRGIFEDVSVLEDGPNTLHVKVGNRAIVVVCLEYTGSVSADIYALNMDVVLDTASGSREELNAGGGEPAAPPVPPAIAPQTATEGVRSLAASQLPVDFNPTRIKNTAKRAFNIADLLTEADTSARLHGHFIAWGECQEGHDWLGYRQEGVCKKCGAVIILRDNPDFEHGAISGTGVDGSQCHVEWINHVHPPLGE